MNQLLSDNMGLIIVLFMLAILLLFVGILCIAYVILRKNNNNENKDNPQKESDYETIKRKLASEATFSTGQCYIHKEVNSNATCAICEQEICEKCVRQVDNINFCPEHVTTYISNTCSPITNQKTTPDDPEDGVYIYNFKKDLWVKDKIPCFIVTDYKINVEDNYIESYVQLHVRDEDSESLTAQLEKAIK